MEGFLNLISGYFCGIPPFSGANEMSGASWSLASRQVPYVLRLFMPLDKKNRQGRLGPDKECFP